MALEPSILISIVSTAVAAGVLVFGVITHLKNRSLKRQEIILPLTREFDRNEELKYAKQLLDGFPLTIPGPQGPVGEFSVDKLSYLLRDHKQKNVTDPVQISIRNSFTALLGFFAKLGYLMDIGVITRKDLGYFEFYIRKASKTPAVNDYTTFYEGFELYTVLLKKMNLIPVYSNG